jgi:hypothetical protein
LKTLFTIVAYPCERPFGCLQMKKALKMEESEEKNEKIMKN